MNKNTRLRVGYGLSAIIILTAALPVRADDASLGRTPDGVYPMGDAAVVMEAEDITVRLEGNGTTAAVTCEFTFRNEGEAREILLGFPASQKVYSELEDEPGALELKDFHAYIDGTEAAVRQEAGSAPEHITLPSGTEYDQWFTFTVPFAAGETKQIRNTYTVKNLYYSNGEAVAGYVLRTGAFWQGPIGRARVTFDLGNVKLYQITRVYPNCFRYEDSKLIFEREGFEPRYDLEIMFDAWHYSPEFLATASADVQAEIAEKIGDFDEMEGKVAELAGAPAAEIRAVYDAAVAANDPIQAMYIAGRLLAEAIANEPPVISAITAESGGGRSYRIAAAASDPNGDFVAWDVKVSHTEDGKEITDLQDEMPLTGTGYTAEPAYWVTMESGKEYRIEFGVRDSADQTARYSASFRDGTVVPETGGTAVVVNNNYLLAVAGLASLVVLAITARKRIAG